VTGRRRLVAWLARRPEATGLSLASPGALWLLAFFVAPIAIMLAYSFMRRGTYGGVETVLTLEQYRRFLYPLYLGILGRTVLWSAVCTLACLVLGYPVAWVIARARRWRHVLLFLVVLPFWTSFLVRMFAMIFLLRDGGLVNSTLASLGLIDEPIPLLYTPFAVVLGLVYGFLPLMILPIYAALEKLDDTMLEAAEALGAKPFARFTRVIWPLSRPGVAAGAVLTFIPALGSFVTADLLGGARHAMIGNVIQSQFTAARNWPFGSALSFVLMGLVLVPVLAWLRRRDRPAVPLP
jgi:spermidine/putrescine transport system permease protein